MSIFAEVPLSATPIQPAESDFEFLQRSSWPACELARRRVVDWLNQWPREKFDNMASRIVSRDDQQHEAAIFELYVHSFLLQRGVRIVEYEPRLGAQHPDFLTEIDGRRVLLEVIVINGETPELRAQASHEWAVQCAIDAIPSTTHYLIVRFRKAFTSSPKTARVAHEVCGWLGRSARSARLRIEEAGGLIEVEMGPARRRDAVAIIGIVLPHDGSGFSQAAQDIKRKLKKKSAQLSASDMPAIVVAKMNSLLYDDFDIKTALFGSERFTFRVDTGEVVKVDRADDAILLHRGRPQHTSLSGLVSFRGAEIWATGEPEITYWQNPWARLPFNGSGLGIERWIADHDAGELRKVQP